MNRRFSHGLLAAALVLLHLTLLPLASQAGMFDPGDEFARQVREHAHFNYRLIGEMDESGLIAALPEARREAVVRDVTELLWRLRFIPEVMEREKHKLLSSPGTVEQRITHLQLFVRRNDFRALSLYGRLHGMTREEIERRKPPVSREELRPYFRFVVRETDEIPERYASLQRVLGAMYQLRDEPWKLTLMQSILGDPSLPPDCQIRLAMLVPEYPELVMTRYERMDVIRERNERLLKIWSQRPGPELIGPELAGFSPETMQQVASRKIFPLAGKKKEVSRRVRMGKVDTAFDDFARALAAASPRSTPPQPDFLQPGENLYLVLSMARSEHAVSILLDGPLDDYALMGPSVLPYMPETLPVFRRFLSDGQEHGAYMVAASGSAQDLAEHLASLALVRSQPEHAHYGSLERGIRSTPGAGAPLQPEPVFQLGRRAYRLGHAVTTGLKPGQSIIPRRQPEAFGTHVDNADEAIRLTRLTTPSFFCLLGMIADDNGLARLFGPIRTVWHNQSPVWGEPEWHQLRYLHDPALPKRLRREQRATLPALDQKDVERLVILEREVMLTHSVLPMWHLLACSRREISPRSEQGAALLQRLEGEMRETASRLVAEGFVSPQDLGDAMTLLGRVERNDREDILKAVFTVDGLERRLYLLTQAILPVL